MSISLLVDSCSDLPLEYVEKNNDAIEIIGMPINIENEEYIDDLGKNLSHEMFYDKLYGGIMPTTSQINVSSFLEKYEKLYDEGKSIIYIGFTSGMSGTINNATLAKNMFIEEHDDADITIIDTLSASVGLGILVVEALDMLRNGKSKEEIVNWIENNKMKSNHWFAVNDLMHLKNGGRIPPAIAVLGTVLSVKPVLIVDENGKLGSYTNVRGRKKSLKFLVNKLFEHMGNESDTTIMIGHANCYEDALKIQDMILSECKPKKIIVSEISATIATHVGPGMIALAFVGKNIRESK